MANRKRVGFSAYSADTVVDGTKTISVSVPIRGWITRIRAFVTGEAGGMTQLSLDIQEAAAPLKANLVARWGLTAKPAGSYYYIDGTSDLYYEVAENVKNSKFGLLYLVLDRDAGSGTVTVRIDVESGQ